MHRTDRIPLYARTLFALGLCLFLPPPVFPEYRPVDLTLIGFSYGSPMRPMMLSNAVDDGFGIRGQLDVKPVRALALCVGAERMRFYKPHQYHFLAGTVDLSAKFILPPQLGGVGYLQSGIGFNVLGNKGNTWGGKTCGRIIVGRKVIAAPGFGIDLSVGYHMMGKPEAFKYVDVRVGASIGIGRDTDPTPTVTSTRTPKSAAMPVATGTVKVEPAPLDVHSPTPTPNVIQLESDIPTFTPAAISTAAAVTLTLADRTMRDTYDAGITAYRKGQYPKAIRLLKQALAIKDVTQFWYYAEANAMLGAIYHYKVKPVNRVLARKYYQAALKIDPKTRTAKKGMARLKATAPNPAPKPKPRPKPAQDDLADEVIGITPVSGP